MTSTQENSQRRLILDLACKYKYNEKHAAFVEKASLVLFESLGSLHKFGQSERILLSHAGLLHDIGSYISEKQHNKHTKYIIDKDELLDNYPEDRRVLLSLIAHNHRKKIHKDTVKLDKKERNIALKLSALLRIADSLYYTNDETTIKCVVVENSSVKVSVEGVLPERLSKKFNEKKDLFEEVFGFEINLV
jgi:exopolyphosphatase/guanosine-5'-triphosphate,3'-diphosphate pyrophosphatase